MTPDKVEAALVRALCDADGGRSPPASYERMAKAALATLTSALAERERDAARWRSALEEILAHHADDNARPKAFYIAAAAMKDTDHDR